SIYPFAWNVLLAARHEGFAGTITTLAVAQEPKLQALLGIPAHVAVASVMPLGRPVRALTKLRRKTVAEFAMREQWGGPPPGGGGRTYTFKLRRGVKFHDGSEMTSRDVKASYDRIVAPPPGVVSFRKGQYTAVEAIEVPDPSTIVFRLKWPTASFLTATASPFNWIYKADILARDQRWYERNVMGTGPF